MARQVIGRTLLGLSIAAGTAVAAPPFAQAATNYSVLQINMCNSGYAGCYSGRAQSQTIALIKSRAPYAVTLNEACSNDVSAIASQLNYRGQFTQSGTQKCKNGYAYGNAVLFKPGVTARSVVRHTYTAQNSTVEKRTLSCATGAFRVCVTHLATSGTARTSQAAQMMSIMASYNSGGVAILGGDWNMRYGGSPNAQTYVPSGMYRKGDGALQHFIASNGFRFSSTRVMSLTWTDHPGFQLYVSR